MLDALVTASVFAIVVLGHVFLLRALWSRGTYDEAFAVDDAGRASPDTPRHANVQIFNPSQDTIAPAGYRWPDRKAA